jgi:hypothetical protein
MDLLSRALPPEMKGAPRTVDASMGRKVDTSLSEFDASRRVLENEGQFVIGTFLVAGSQGRPVGSPGELKGGFGRERERTRHYSLGRWSPPKYLALKAVGHYGALEAVEYWMRRSNGAR